jgi:hypothetical protein
MGCCGGTNTQLAWQSRVVRSAPGDPPQPALNQPYFVATPPDTPYPTDIYTIEYDGVPDFPQYPIDIPAASPASRAHSCQSGNCVVAQREV